MDVSVVKSCMIVPFMKYRGYQYVHILINKFWSLIVSLLYGGFLLVHIMFTYVGVFLPHRGVDGCCYGQIL